MKTASNVLVIVLGVALLGLYLHDRREQRLRENEQHAMLAALSTRISNIGVPTPTAPIVITPGERLDDAELGKIANAVAARIPPPAQSVEPAAPSAAEQAGADDARNRLTRSIASGQLRRDDVLAMRAQLSSPNLVHERDEIVHDLVMAINAQKLVPEDRFAIFP